MSEAKYFIVRMSVKCWIRDMEFLREAENEDDAVQKAIDDLEYSIQCGGPATVEVIDIEDLTAEEDRVPEGRNP